MFRNNYTFISTEKESTWVFAMLILVGFLHLEKLVIFHFRIFMLRMGSCSLKVKGGLRSKYKLIMNHHVVTLWVIGFCMIGLL